MKRMVDTEKRGKVMRSLELCAYDPDPGQELKEIRSCPECPYYRAGCSPQLIRDALSLLKAQEPRVLTLEELQEIETPWNRNTPPYLWVEERYTTRSRWMSWGFMRDGVRLRGTMGVQNYGSKWRVWNLQPTPEQMRDTKWEGENE